MSSAVSSLARIALPLVGAAVGSAFGAPGVGALVGSLIGSALFPPKGPTEPIAPDVQPTNSTEGAALPEFFGSCVTAGNVFWDGGRRVKTKKKKVGGIVGIGGTTVKTRKYFRTYAIGLGKEIGGIRRAWRNGLIVYDRRPQQDGESNSAYTKRLAASDELEEKMTIYLGTADQLPDPTMESKLGVGNAPAYRKRSYVVFNDLEETERRGAMSSWKFEVVKQGLVYTPTSELAADSLSPWIEGTNDPRGSGTFQYYKSGVNYDSPTQGPTRDSLSEALADYDVGYELDPFVIGWSYGAASTQVMSPFEEVETQDRVVLFLHFNRDVEQYIARLTPVGVFSYCQVLASQLDPGEINVPFWWSGVFTDGSSAGGAEYYPGVYELFDYNPSDPWNDRSNNCPTLGTGLRAVQTLDTLIEVFRVPAAPAIPGADLPDWPGDPDDYTWDEDAGQIYSKEPYALAAGSYRWLSLYATAGEFVTRYPLGPVLEVGDASDTESYWTSAYNAAVTAGDLPAGMTYNAAGTGGITTYPRNASYAWTRTYTAITFPDTDGDSLANIVRRCSQLADLSEDQIDVTDLTEIVRGFQLDQVQTARGAIDSLRRFGFFDVVASGNQIKYPTRGKASVAEITLDDLGAHLYGESEPDKLRAEYVNDQELPKVVRVSYINQSGEYQRGQQLRGRTVTGSADITDVQVPVVMSADKAAQIRDVALAEPWIGRETYTAQVGPEWLYLEPADAIVVPLRGDTQRVIVSRIAGAPGGVQSLELRRDDASIYYPDATGVPSGVGESVLDQAGDTTLIIIDGPALGSEANDAGVYLAAHGEGTRWTGYSLLQSLDGGGEYDDIGDIEGASTMGLITAALPAGPYELWDRANTLEVTLEAGTLESTTEAAVLAGANLAWVGHPDRGWELVQFADATLTGTDGEGRSIYDVSTFLRGRLGTEWAIGGSEAGDYFILAETCERLGLENSEIGVTRLFKAVTFGRLEETGPTQSFTPAAVALECFAPTLIEGQRDGSDNLLIYGLRRARISGEWNDSDFVPLNEETEAYEVDVLDGATVVRTITAGSFPIAYSAADQVTDFGSVQSAIDIVVYQLSATVGRGYPTEATV